MKRILAFVLASVFLGVLSLPFCMPSDYHSPPVMTPSEMEQRTYDAGQKHLDECWVCSQYGIDQCYMAAVNDALVVGDWVCAFCSASGEELGWVYIGEPLKNVKWNIDEQKWEKQ